MQVKDGGAGLEWQDVVGQEPETTTTTMTTAADGRRLARIDMDDDDAVFGELIVRELRHIGDPQTKLILRHNILTMIYETRLGCLHGGGARAGCGHHPGQSPSTALRRVDQGDRRSSAVGGGGGSRRAHSSRDDVDSADVAFHRENHTDADDGDIVIKEEVE